MSWSHTKLIITYILDSSTEYRSSNGVGTYLLEYDRVNTIHNTIQANWCCGISEPFGIYLHNMQSGRCPNCNSICEFTPVSSPAGKSCSDCLWVIPTRGDQHTDQAVERQKRNQDLRLRLFSHPQPAITAELLAFTRDRWEHVLQPVDFDRANAPRAAGITLAAVRSHRSGISAEQHVESERLCRSLSESGIRVSSPVVSMHQEPAAHVCHCSATSDPTTHRTRINRALPSLPSHPIHSTHCLQIKRALCTPQDRLLYECTGRHRTRGVQSSPSGVDCCEYSSSSAPSLPPEGTRAGHSILSACPQHVTKLPPCFDRLPHRPGSSSHVLCHSSSAPRSVPPARPRYRIKASTQGRRPGE